jgi:spoIIIJ-associated protein
MINIYKIEGKNEQELLEKFLEENKLSENDVYYNFTEAPTKLFKSKKIILNLIKKSDILIYIKEYIDNLSKEMNIDIKYEVNYKDETINILLISENNPILIGKEGRTLNSIQILLKQALSIQTGIQIKLNLDVSNYKAKKMKNLEYEIKKIAKEIEKTKIDVVLDTMNSYERRFVHNIISEFPLLESKSSGEGKERKITISYKK